MPYSQPLAVALLKKTCPRAQAQAVDRCAE